MKYLIKREGKEFPCLVTLVAKSFKNDFIAGMPHPGGEIKGLDIQK